MFDGAQTSRRSLGSSAPSPATQENGHCAGPSGHLTPSACCHRFAYAAFITAMLAGTCLLLATSAARSVHHRVGPLRASSISPPASSAWDIRERAPASDSSVFFVLGGPGSGKGTQCDLLREAFGMCHLSAGDLLRAEASKPTELGESISKILVEGQIVPSHVTVSLLAAAMRERPGPFLIDGFPRSMENLKEYKEGMGDDATCEFVLFLDLSEEVMCRRLLGRSEVSDRSDDNEVTIKKRFKTFQEQTMPVIDLMAKQGLVRRVPADGTPEEVFAAVRSLFDDALAASSPQVLPSPRAG